MRYIDFDRRILLFLLLYCFGTQLSAQIAKEHYIPPLYYPLGELDAGYTSSNKCDQPYINRQELSLATNSQTAISVTITDGTGNALSGIGPVTISRGNPMTLELGNEDQSTPIMVQTSLVNEVIADKGLVLKSTKPFYASLRIATDSNKCSGNTASSSLKQADFMISKGKKSLGRAFRLVNIELTPSGVTNPNDLRVKWDQLKNHYVGIMATEDNTTVRLSEYPQSLKLGVYDPVAGQVIGIKNIQDRDTLSLDKGESFVFVAPMDATNPRGFTGTLVTSDNPIAVNVGNMYGSDFDLMVDQIVPIKRLGTEYAIIKGEGQRQKYEQGIVVATEDNTTVSVDGSVVKTLAKAGDFYQVHYVDNTNTSTPEGRYIKTSKPAYVYQVLAAAKGKVKFVSGNNYVNITTTLSIIPPLSDYNYSYLNMVSRVNQIGLKTFGNSYILALIKKTASIVVNNGLVRASSSNLTGNNDWAIHKIYNTTKNIVVESGQPMAVGIYSGDDNLGYSGYFTGFSVLEAEMCSSDSATDIFDYMQVPDPTFTGTIGTWNPAFASGTNIFDPSVDVEGEYEYQYQANFTFLQKTQKVKITITPALDITGMNISRLANKVCIGDDTSYELDAPNLLDGDYRLRYSIEKTGIPTIAKIEEITINNHKASINILAKDISTLGTYTLKLTKIENDVCEEILALQQDLEITPDVDVTGITLTGKTCKNDNGDYTVTIKVPSGSSGDTYNLSYKVSGANTISNQVVDITLDAKKEGTWDIAHMDIPNSIDLSKNGANTVELVSIQYKNSVCADKKPMGVTFPFDTFYSNSTTMSISSRICQGSDLIVAVDDVNFPDDTYEIKYELSQSNTSSKTIEIAMLSGKGSFTIPASELTNNGTSDLEIQSIVKKGGSCTLALAVKDSFEITPDVDITGIVLSGIDCQTDKTDYTVGIEMMNAADGEEYTLKYKVTGGNTIVETSIDITLNSQKKETWIIPYTAINKIGTNKIELVSIQYKNTVCAVKSVTNIDKSFETFYSDDTKIIVSNSDVCQGEDLSLTITDGNLLDGTYKIEYEITGSNAVTSSQEILLTSGTRFWGIPALEIPNAGSNTLKITSIKEKNSPCVLPLSISNNFEVFPDVNQNGIILTGSDCQIDMTDYTVGIEMTNATAGDEYTLNYKITGANTQSNTPVDIILDANKKGTWAIPYAGISNMGTNMIELISIQYKNSAICPFRTLSNVNKSFETFYSNNTKVTVTNDICQGDNLILSISDSNLLDGLYEIGYEVTGSNTVTAGSQEIPIRSGGLFWGIPASEIPNAGMNTVKITYLKEKTSSCVLPLSIIDNFEVFPDVNKNGITLTGLDCQTTTTDYTIGIEMMNATAGDEYILNYKITGTNPKPETSLDITLDTNKKATWTIPYAEISNIGINAIELTSIQYKSSVATCSFSLLSNVNKLFETIYTNTLTPTVPAKICQGSDLSVEITDANLPDATYEIKYEISQSNAITSTREIAVSSGKGTLVIPASELINYGNNTFEIQSINRKGSTCVLSLSTNDSFEITPNVNIINIFLIGDFCKTTSTDYEVTIQIPNGNPTDEYTLKYEVTGANPQPEKSLDITLDANKKATWMIPYADIKRIGFNTVVLTEIQFKTTLCPATSVSNIETTFETIYTNILTPTVPAKICQGSDLSVDITDANLPDGTYEIKYEISQSNAITSTREMVMSSGKGTLVIPASALINYGNNTLEIQSIKRKGGACVLPLSISNNFEITPNVNISNIALTGDFCKITSTDYQVTIEMPNGNPSDEYTLKYEVIGGNTQPETSLDITLDANKKATWMIPYADINKIGTNTIALTAIQFKTTLCPATSISNIDISFETIYTNTLTTAVPLKICQGLDLSVEITDVNLPDKTYEIKYKLSQSNAITNTREIAMSSGKGTLVIPASELPNYGNNTFEIESINRKRSTCILPLSISNNFEITPDVNITNIALTGDACKITSTDYQVTIEVPNGNPLDEYMLKYKVTGTNTKRETSLDITLDASKKATWTIPYLEISKIGMNKIELVSIQYKNTVCAVKSVTNIDKSFETIYTNTLRTTVFPKICQGTDLSVSITDGNLPDDTYEIKYKVSQSNTVNNTIAIAMLSGRGSFIIPASKLSNDGLNTLEIQSINRKGSTCILPLSMSDNFEITPNVDITNIILTGADCKIDIKDYEVTIEMPNGNPSDKYTLKYKMMGANTKRETSLDITLDANKKATWTIPYLEISKIGINTISLTAIQFKTTLCTVKSVTNIDKSFETIYTNTLTPTVPSKICQGTALSVEITDANLSDATYEIKYKISQSNAVTNTREIAISSGKGTLVIPASELLNYGNNTFEIESINRKGSTCILPLSTSDNFDIAPVLLTSELSITANTCIVIDPTVGMTVDIVNSNPTTTTDVYTVTYEIRGANILSAKTQDVTMINTNGQLIIPASEISKAGDSTILIKEIKHKGETCATTLNLQYPIHTIYEASLRTMSNSIAGNACTLTDQTIEIALDNAIAGKSYQFLYTLSGANKSNDVEVSVIPDNQGKASFNIPNTFFPNEGITKVSFKTIADCEDRITNTKAITTDIFMNLTPIISATDILVDKYFCFGSDVDVSINNINTFKNGKTYTVTYKLSGANNTLEKTHTQSLTNQKISFIIPGSEILSGGVTNVNITKIESSDGCVYNQLTSKSFTVVQIDTSEISFRKQNNCDGSSLIKINNPRIPITGGEYQLNYTINRIVKTVNLQGDRGFIIMNILRENFKEGQNTIQLNSLKHNLSGCFATFKNDEIHQIDKQGLLDFDAIRMTTPTLFCKNEKGLEVEISTPTLSSNTTNFIIEYDLLGVNQHENISQEVVIDANKVIFEIPIKYFTNRGNGVITIKNIRVKNESCEGNNIDISKDFYTSTVTDIFREEVKEKYSFCKDDNPTLSDIYLSNPISPNIFWYDSVDATQPIDQSTIIKESTILYARRVNADKCLGNYVTTEIDFTLCDKIVFPTKVSANGDNINDEFYIQDLEELYPNYTLNIYDRNGVMVYQDNSSTPSFKGISNQSEQMLNQNNKLPKGIYYYILNYNSLVNKRKKPIQGYFYLDY